MGGTGDNLTGSRQMEKRDRRQLGSMVRISMLNRLGRIDTINNVTVKSQSPPFFYTISKKEDMLL